MLLHYARIREKLLYVSPTFNRLFFKPVLLFFVLLVGCSLNLSAQTTASDTTAELSALFSERTELVSQSKSTRELDRRIYQLGSKPKAIIQTSTLENGTIRLEFPYYLDISERSTGRITQMVTQQFPFLTSIDYNLPETIIVCLLAAGTSESQLEEITNYFGFSGYEKVN